MQYAASPMLMIDSVGVVQIDDTVYAQNLFVKFAGVSNDKTKIKIGVKESDGMIDFVTLKAYVFPYINLVWLGLIVMAAGFLISLNKRAKLSTYQGLAMLIVTSIALFYMFLLAN
jgi:cytochrome c-type biogenesis protein CcmF